MPRLASIYTDPFLSDMSLSLYSLMVLFGDVLDADVNVLRSLEWGHEVKFEMSMVMNLAFLMGTTLLKRSFATNMSDVGVATSLG